MHSSRMRTARLLTVYCASRVGVLPGGVLPGGVLPVGVSIQGALLRGVSAWGVVGPLHPGIHTPPVNRMTDRQV